MFFSKITVTLLSAIAATPFAMGAEVSYPAVLVAAVAKHNRAMTASELNAKLMANGMGKKIQDGLRPKLGWGKGVVCDTTCPACADCATGAGQAGIVMTAAWAGAAWACLTVMGCPEAIAGAVSASLTAQALFCNAQHQNVLCSSDCSWQVAPCKTRGAVAPGPTKGTGRV